MRMKKIRPAPGKEPQKILRLLDANLNRCREGLRVLEDTARFVWENESLFQKFRRERHQLDRLTRHFYAELLHSRDSQDDRGREIKEGGRKNLEAVAAANFRRCEESLRVLEEYGKLKSGPAAASFKKMRFEIYELEKTALRLKVQ